MAKFQKKKLDDLARPGQAVMVYTAESADECKMRANSAGVVLEGTLTFLHHDDLQDFAKALSDAWKDHLTFRKALNKSLYV